jgi:hypothetical protein
MMSRTEWHPDTGQLAAYAERKLNDSERDRVIVHLADCDGCRRVALLCAATEVVAGSCTCEPTRPASWVNWSWVFAKPGFACAVSFALLIWYFSARRVEVARPTDPSRQVMAEGSTRPAGRIDTAPRTGRVRRLSPARRTHTTTLASRSSAQYRFPPARYPVRLLRSGPPVNTVPIPVASLESAAVRSAAETVCEDRRSAELLLARCPVAKGQSQELLPIASLKLPDGLSAPADRTGRISFRLLPNFRYSAIDENPVKRWEALRPGLF